MAIFLNNLADNVPKSKKAKREIEKRTFDQTDTILLAVDKDNQATLWFSQFPFAEIITFLHLLCNKLV